MSFATEFEAYCQIHGMPDQIELLLCDLNGVLRGKRIPGEAAAKLEKGAVRLPLSTCAPDITGHEVPGTGLGIEFGDPDGVLVPLSQSLRPAPWLSGHVAQVSVEMTDIAGGISENSPQAILTSVLDRFTARGWRPVVATELEFYILRDRPERDAPPQPPAFSPDAQNYDLELLARREDILNDILSAAAAQGMPMETLIVEYGQGQFEVNFHHSSDVHAATEMALLSRRLVRGVVASHGYEATFMAKPYADQPGNGMHVHMSLLDGSGDNLFSSQRDGEIDPRLKRAVAGLLDTMRDLQAIFAPHANSYRRFRPNSFAPASPDWGFDNRAAAVRLPEVNGPGARLEHRISGADINPYLAMAAILGGVLHGLDAAPELPAPLDDGIQRSEPLTHDWATAVERFATAPIAKTVFGRYRELYTTVKRAEIATVQNVIPPAEYAYYLSRF